MVDVFVSYKREDRGVASALAAALEGSGFAVWWDDDIDSREPWDRQIQDKISQACAVLVLWSPASIASDWVSREAHFALDRSKLVPIFVAACQVPLAFTLIQTLDLSKWRGETDARDWAKLLTWLEDLRLAASRQGGDDGTQLRNAFRRVVATLDSGEDVYEGAFIGQSTPAGTAFVDAPEAPVMRVVPAGTVLLRAAGQPAKRVTFASAFAVSMDLVSTDCFNRFMPQAPVGETPKAPVKLGLFAKLAARPQTAGGVAPAGPPREPGGLLSRVSFDEAVALAAAISQATGQAYRLPSEAEWEYCCRAGTSTAYAFGDAITPANAWYASADGGSLPRGPTEAGRFGANAFGLRDMHGNLREWTQDCWQASYDTTPPDGLPYLDNHGAMRVVRGGGWADGADQLRSSARSRATASLRSDQIGVRLVREIR